MKTVEIRTMALDEMEQKVEEFKKQLFHLRIELKTGKLEKHARIRDLKKSIARLLTIIVEEKNRGKQDFTPKDKKGSP